MAASYPVGKPYEGLPPHGPPHHRPPEPAAGFGFARQTWVNSMTFLWQRAQSHPLVRPVG